MALSVSCIAPGGLVMKSRKLSGLVVANYPKPRVVTIRGVQVLIPVPAHEWWAWMTRCKGQ